MTNERLLEFLGEKNWKTVGITYLNLEPLEVRTCYYHCQKLQEAIEWFDSLESTKDTVLLSVWLDNEIDD